MSHGHEGSHETQGPSPSVTLNGPWRVIHLMLGVAGALTISLFFMEETSPVMRAVYALAMLFVLGIGWRAFRARVVLNGDYLTEFRTLGRTRLVRFEIEAVEVGELEDRVVALWCAPRLHVGEGDVDLLSLVGYAGRKRGNRRMRRQAAILEEWRRSDVAEP